MTLPPLGIVGTYQFSPPVTDAVGNDRLAVAEAIHSIEALENDIDFSVLKSVYLDNGLTDENYNADKLNRVSILQLRFSNEKIHYIPSTYVIGVPSKAGIGYNGTAVALTLGMLPTDFNTDKLEEDVRALCSNRYGIEAETTKVIVSDEVRLLEYEHQRLEQQRLSRILSEEKTETNLYDITTLQLSLKRAEQQIRYLESYILRCRLCKPCAEITERVTNDVSLLETCTCFEAPDINRDADTLFTSEEITWFNN